MIVLHEIDVASGLFEPMTAPALRKESARAAMAGRHKHERAEQGGSFDPQGKSSSIRFTNCLATGRYIVIRGNDAADRPKAAYPIWISGERDMVERSFSSRSNSSTEYRPAPSRGRKM